MEEKQYLKKKKRGSNLKGRKHNSKVKYFPDLNKDMNLWIERDPPKTGMQNKNTNKNHHIRYMLVEFYNSTNKGKC